MPDKNNNVINAVIAMSFYEYIIDYIFFFLLSVKNNRREKSNKSCSETKSNNFSIVFASYNIDRMRKCEEEKYTHITRILNAARK